MSLELIPSTDLAFKGPFNIVSTTTLKLANSGKEKLAYKIKTTAPKRYCVKPNSGFLDPNDTINVHVMLQPQPAGQLDDRAKHKFMVQWVCVTDNPTKDIEAFWKQDFQNVKVQDAKLKCVFIEESSKSVSKDSDDLRSNNPSQRPIESTNSNEIHIQQQTNSSNIYKNQRISPPLIRSMNPVQSFNPDRQQNIDDDSNKTRLKEDVDSLKKENENMKNKLQHGDSTLRQRIAGSSTIGDRTNPIQQQENGLLVGGVTVNLQIFIMALIFAVLFGLLLGHMFFSCSN